MPSTPGQIVEAAKARWDRTTPRERLLLAGLTLAAAAALPVAANDWAGAQAAREAEDAGRLTLLQSRDDGARLRGAEARVAALEAKVRAWTPSAPSFAVARVQAEQEAALAGAQSGMTLLEIRTADTPDRIGDLSLVRIDLSGTSEAGRLGGLVTRLAAVRPGWIVERAATEPGAPPRLRLVLLAPFRTTARS